MDFKQSGRPFQSRQLARSGRHAPEALWARGRGRLRPNSPRVVMPVGGPCNTIRDDNSSLTIPERILNVRSRSLHSPRSSTGQTPSLVYRGRVWANGCSSSTQRMQRLSSLATVFRCSADSPGRNAFEVPDEALSLPCKFCRLVHNNVSSARPSSETRWSNTAAFTSSHEQPFM